MVRYFIKTGGSDGAAGTSYATAWATLDKAIGTGAGMASGDELILCGGVVLRLSAAQPITLAPTGETKIIGDPHGVYSADVGEVVITGYGTNDSTAPFSGNLTSFAAARNLYTWENITFRTPAGVLFPLSTSTGWTFTDCTFYGRVAGGSNMFTHTTTAGAASNILFNRCRFKQMSASAVFVITSTLHTGDYDVNIEFRNCHIRSNAAFCTMSSTTAAGAGIPYGVKCFNCTMDADSKAILTVTSAAHSIAGGGAVSQVKRCLLDCGSGAVISAGNTNQITADWNRMPGGGTYTNTTAGANDLATNAKSYFPDLGQLTIFGFQQRPYLSPGVSDPHGAFVSDGSGLSTDLLNRPVPSGQASLSTPVGALGRHNAATKETSVTDAGGVAIKITGPGNQDIHIPVTAAATVITLRCRYDTNHAATNKPQAILLANGEIGVATETETAAAGVDTWETLTFSSFTPTAAGVVTIRLVSRSAAANGIAYFDTVTVA